MRCIICNKNSNKYLCFYNLLSNKEICCKCYESFVYQPQIINYKSHKIKILFKYNDAFRKLILIWKMDKNPTANKILANLIKKFIYVNKWIIYPPSFKKPNLQRMLNYLKLKNKNIFLKENNNEQKSKNYFSRNANFKLVKNIPKNFILIDDVYTSGSTIRKSLDLLEEKGYKNVKVIIFATTQNFDNKK